MNMLNLPNMRNFYIKTQSYIKVSSSKALEEYELQKYLSSRYDFIPKIHSLKLLDTYSEITMDMVVNGTNLFEKYSDNSSDIPEWIWNKIRNIVQTLYYKEGIEYIDITPYNFMIDSNNKIWLIDFGHAYYTNVTMHKPSNWFLSEFIFDQVNLFNPDFA